MHWDGFSPEDLQLSYIYKYESADGGFVKYDIDGDGTLELLMGDQTSSGDYQIYDIFTFDKSNGDIIHLFCGGERNWCTIIGQGVIMEKGSNSAEDSFTNYYELKNLKLNGLNESQVSETCPIALNMDKFINYAKPQQEHLCGGYTEQREISEEERKIFRQVLPTEMFTPLSVATQVVAGLNYCFRCRFDTSSAGSVAAAAAATSASPTHCYVTIYRPLQGDPVISGIRDENGGPEMKVVVGKDGDIGRYLGENETSYHAEIQDDYWVEKANASIETVKACDGQGILSLKVPGSKAVFSVPDTTSSHVGTMIHEEGYVPEVYRCLGYVRGWFLVDISDKSGFVREDFVAWDAINSF